MTNYIKTRLQNLAQLCNGDLTTINGEPTHYTFSLENLEKFRIEVMNNAFEVASVQCETDLASNDGITCAEYIRELKVL